MEENQQTNPEQEVQKTPKEQAEDAVKIAKQMNKGYAMLWEREIWSYLNALTAPRISENEKYQLKKSLVRSLTFARDFKTGVHSVELLQKGRLAQIENNLAMAAVKIDEGNMLLMADNLRKQDEANEAKVDDSEIKPLEELLTETKEETNV